MHKTSLSLTKLIVYGAALVIVLMPFHAFLTVWSSSLLGHYTAIRLWKELILFLLIAGGFVVFVRHRQTRKTLLGDRLFQVILLYISFLIVAVVLGLVFGTVSIKAAAYGLLLDSRYLLFFCVTWLVTLHSDLLLRKWCKLLLIPAAVVAGFAALQYLLLPADFLRHFGYGLTTIPPNETIDQKAAYRRVQSTLRGANPLGAYLVVVLSAVGGIVLGNRRHRIVAALGFVTALLALFATFSRSAWIGALISLLLLLWLSLRSRHTRQIVAAIACAAVLGFAAVGLALRHNERFQNVVFHTSNTSHSSQSSNAGHASALKNGVIDVVRQPWGRGVGTAGPASVYNKTPARIAEDYYVQIAQETGVEGLIVFVVINALLGIRLWRRRQHQLGLVLVVSFVGLAIVNLLLHGWADDTLAYVFWGFAGAAMALPEYVDKDHRSEHDDAVA